MLLESMEKTHHEEGGEEVESEDKKRESKRK